jgi:phage shock protein E
MLPRPQVLFLVVLAAGAYVWLSQGGPVIPAEQARELVKGGGLLVDVRTPAEYAAGHLEGAVNLPLGTLEEAVGDPALRADARDLVVYCRSGHRSAQAVAKLKKAGFARVHDLGSLSNWR